MKLLYFAWIREKIGAAEEQISPPAEVKTVRDLVTWLSARGPGHAAAFADAKRVRCALDREFVTWDAGLEGATEVAFFPPVTGG
jgi:molybdopterin synthase sulfur carrier subunit